MGCDIHMFLERKRSTDTAWQLDSKHIINHHNHDDDSYSETTIELTTGRSYRLFGALAGVRCFNNNITPKGIPDDASDGFIIACKQWHGDAHSHSYYSIQEYKQILKSLGCLYMFNVNTYKWRNPIIEWYDIHDDMQLFNTVLAYVHDEMESNRIYYLLTNDSYYLNEQYRVVFFFDN